MLTIGRLLGHARSLLLGTGLVLLAGCDDADDIFIPPPPGEPMTIHPQALPEGAQGEVTTMQVLVSVTEPINEPVTIQYQTEALSAVAGEDYIETFGEVTLAAGTLEQHIPVYLLGDDIEEPAEQFRLRLRVGDRVSLASDSVVATIANDDTACDKPYEQQPNRWRVNGGDPMNYAHRGGVIDFPENTLYAYKQVAAAGADVLEMDVYQTADNQLVIIHDLDVDRTTNGSGNVVDLTLAELQSLDAAYWFVAGEGTPNDAPESAYEFRGIATGEVPPPAGYTAADFRIPTLEQALMAFPDKLINVELKPDLDGVGDYESQIAGLLRRYGRFDDVIVASFVDQAANNFKAIAPCIHTSVPLEQATALVLGSQGSGTILPVPEHVAFQVPPDTSQIQQVADGFVVVTEDFVGDAHNAGLAVQVWTVNSCEQMLEMMALGVDAIMTDRPLLLQSLLDQAPASRSCN